MAAHSAFKGLSVLHSVLSGVPRCFRGVAVLTAVAAALSVGGCDDSTTPSTPVRVGMRPDPVMVIEGLPDDPLPVGVRIRVFAVVLYPEGFRETLRDSLVAWTSSDPAVASVTQYGAVEARAEGTARITATFEHVRAEAPVRVDAAPEPENIFIVGLLERSEWDSLSGLSGRQTVTILESDVGFTTSSDCGSWTRVPTETTP